MLIFYQKTRLNLSYQVHLFLNIRAGVPGCLPISAISTQMRNNLTLPHQVGGNKEFSLQWRNPDQKLLETVFFIAICRPTLFLAIFDLRSSIVSTFLIGAYSLRKTVPMGKINVIEQLHFEDKGH